VGGQGPGPRTVNSWANSQSGVVPVKSNTAILVATVAGMLLLVGGGIGAYFMLKPAPAAAPVSAAGSAAETEHSPEATTAAAAATAPTAEAVNVDPNAGASAV